MNKRKEMTESWSKVKKELDEAFDRAGIFDCELRLPGCDNRFVAFAHSKKRRFIPPPKDIFDKEGWKQYRRDFRQVARLCQKCHEKIEYRGHKKMFRWIKRVERKRGWHLN